MARTLVAGVDTSTQSCKVRVTDAETGENVWVDTSSASTRGAYADHWQRTNALIDRTLSRCRVDNVRIATDEDYVKSLMKLFKRR